MVDFSQGFKDGLIKAIKERGQQPVKELLLASGYCESFINVMIKHVTKPKVLK